MFAEAVWKQIEKKRLSADGVVDRRNVRELEKDLDAASLGRKLFELTAAARAQGLDPEEALRLHATEVMREIDHRAQAPSLA